MPLPPLLLLAASIAADAEAPAVSRAQAALPAWNTASLRAGPALDLKLPCAEPRSTPRIAAPCAGERPIVPELTWLSPDESAALGHRSLLEPGPKLMLPSLGGAAPGALGGFLNFDVVAAPRLRLGPELSWMTPDSPREDLPRLRVVAPGWGFRYTPWAEADIAVGATACTRFLTLAEDWPVVDVLTSEARFELSFD